MTFYIKSGLVNWTTCLTFRVLVVFSLLLDIQLLLIINDANFINTQTNCHALYFYGETRIPVQTWHFYLSLPFIETTWYVTDIFLPIAFLKMSG